MTVRVRPGALSGRVAAIASKSAAHRALLLAALADGPTRLAPQAHSDDIDATLACLAALGASWSREGEGSFPRRGLEFPAGEGGAAQGGGILVRPGARGPSGEADCRESGSTLRFLIPVAAALGVKTRFDGHGRLPERPLGPLISEMKAHGCAFDGEKLPFTLSGKLTGGQFHLPGDVSSQFITGLLLALPLVGGGRILLTSPLESAGYVRMTTDAMTRFGVFVEEIRQAGGAARAPGGEGPVAGWAAPSARYASPGEYLVEGDWSNAAFFLAAGAEVSGLNAQSAQPDRAIGALLGAFAGRFRTIDVRETPDLLPILAAVAAFTRGETRFTGAARLRIKESDRLSSMARGIAAIGGAAVQQKDGLIVRCEGPLLGGEVDACGDHRIAMAFAIAATRCEGPVTIRGAQAVNKSYPGFFDDFRRLGGRADVL